MAMFPVAPNALAQRRAEVRWPAFLGILVAILLTALVNQPQTLFIRYACILVLVLMIIPLLALNPHRLSRETAWSRTLAIAFAVLLVLINQIGMVIVIAHLLGGKASGIDVLVEAGQVWIINVVSFALLYWELDRGGPVSRATLPRAQLPAADFAFPQDDEGAASAEVAQGSSSRGYWLPSYVDYLYVATTNNMAFSPTDAMPLRSRTKLLMTLQSLASFVLLALVISRAVNILT